MQASNSQPNQIAEVECIQAVHDPGLECSIVHLPASGDCGRMTTSLIAVARSAKQSLRLRIYLQSGICLQSECTSPKLCLPRQILRPRSIKSHNFKKNDFHCMHCHTHKVAACLFGSVSKSGKPRRRTDSLVNVKWPGKPTWVRQATLTAPPLAVT